MEIDPSVDQGEVIAQGPPVPVKKGITKQAVIAKFIGPDKKVTGYMTATAMNHAKAKTVKYDDRRYFKPGEYTRVMREFSDAVNAHALELEAGQAKD